MKLGCAILLSFCACAYISAPSAYDGPAGVTFRAPCVERGIGAEMVALEEVRVFGKARIDDVWRLEVEGKNRAFPGAFEATTADSRFLFRLRNQSRKKVKSSILIPFDASDSIGTGFTEPLSFNAFVDGKPVNALRGPELARGMMRIRSRRIPVEIPGGAAVTLEIEATHPLAVNPSWYRFVCADAQLKLPNYKSLAASGCRLEFEFDLADERLKVRPLSFQWKKASEEKTGVELDKDAIRFQGESIEWVSVSR